MRRMLAVFDDESRCAYVIGRSMVAAAPWT